MSFEPPTLPTISEESPFWQRQSPYQNLTKINKKSDQPILIPYDINALAAGVILTAFCESGIPDYWLVSIRPGAGIKISCFNGPQASGVPYRLGGGGKLKLPSVNEYVTVLVEGGSSAASGTIVAIRGYSNFDINPGELA